MEKNIKTDLPDSYTKEELRIAAKRGDVIAAFSGNGGTAVVAAKGGEVVVYNTVAAKRFEKRQSLIDRFEGHVEMIAVSHCGGAAVVGTHEYVVVYEFGADNTWRQTRMINAARLIKRAGGELCVEEDGPDGHSYAITDDGLIKLTDSQLLEV